MEFRGSITALPGSPPLERASWAALCKSHPSFAPIPARLAPNPFKPGEMMKVGAPHDSVRIMASNRDVGVMSWAMDDSALVNVFGDDPIVIQIAEEIAQLLSAAFVQDSA